MLPNSPSLSNVSPVHFFPFRFFYLLSGLTTSLYNKENDFKYSVVDDGQIIRGFNKIVYIIKKIKRTEIL